MKAMPATRHQGLRPEGTSKRAQVALGVSLVLTGFAFLPAVVYADKDHHASTVSPGREQTVQTECPVMIGNKIDPDIYSEYKGKRVYFCCDFCKSAFEKDPEKYLHRLPQFAAVSGEADGDHAGQEHAHGGFSLASLIVPLGVITLSLIAITVFLGLFRRLKPRLMLKWHKRTGVLALLAGAVHAVLVLVAH